MGSTVAAGPATQPSQQDILRKIDALQAEVEQLKIQAQSQKEREQRQETLQTSAALQDEAEAAIPFSLQLEGFTAGYSDGKFLIQSADKRYVLHPWIQLQVRNVTTYRQDALGSAGKNDDIENGWEIRRLKFGFDGNVINPDLTYWLQLAADNKTGAFVLEQAWGKYRLAPTAFFLRAGQFKAPLDHEQLLTSRYLTAAGRMLTDDLFANSEDFVKGASAGFDNNGPLRAELAYTGGDRNTNTSFQPFPTNNANWGVAGRGEWKLSGDWSDYDRSTGAYNAAHNYLALGAGADFTQAGDTATLVHVIDADFGTRQGFGLYGAYLGRYFQNAAIGSVGNSGATRGNVPASTGYDWTLRGQISYAINSHWEPYAQYEYIRLDPINLPAGVRNDLHAIRAGVNYYLFNTEARVTLDITYLPNGTPVSDEGAGLLATGSSTRTAGITRGGGNELVFRAQLQLAL